jgi:N-acetylmuramoyl-L-alanine amidase
MMQRHRLIICVAVAALTGISLFPAGNLLGQVRSDPGLRDPLAGYAQSSGIKPADNDAASPVTPNRPTEEDKKPLAATAAAPSTAPASVSDKVQVTGLRFLSSQQFTRVMLDLSQDAKFEVRRLKEDAAKGIPPRIYIDISGARLAMSAKEPVAVDDGLLRQVRVGQYSAEIVRVVLDMTSLRDHKVFILPDPYRLVVDLQGQKAPEVTNAKDEPAKAERNARPSAAVKDKKASLPASSPGAIRKIVIDPGHGGKDPGAIGAGGIMEKDLVLNIAKKLAVKLKNELGIQVVLTRKDDRFVPLEDRTYMANAEDADLFISLHMNASPNAEARGIETYYLDNTTDEAAMRLAARENASARKSVSDLQFILSDMTQNMKLEDSVTLAYRLQQSAVGGMSKAIGDVRDLGVKKALFYVLVGARMPSVLVEMFFVTHRLEGAAMSREAGQDAMVNSLFEGIRKYGESIMIAKTL